MPNGRGRALLGASPVTRTPPRCGRQKPPDEFTAAEMILWRIAYNGTEAHRKGLGTGHARARAAFAVELVETARKCGLTVQRDYLPETGNPQLSQCR